MKLFIKSAVLIVLLSTVFGCATSGDKFEARLAPPDSLNPIFMGYKELPGEKVMTIAVDPGGSWAFGLDHSRATIEEAAKNATIKCDKARKDYNIFTKAKIFAINNDVVYYDQFK